MPVGSAARFSIEAANYGQDEAHNVTIGLSVDGEAPSDQAVISSIPAGESRGSRFGKARTAGYHAITAQLPPDHLAADDRRTIVVRAVEEVRVLLVAGEIGATPSEGDAFFLELGRSRESLRRIGVVISSRPELFRTLKWTESSLLILT